MSKNRAAWITDARARPLEVAEASEWKAGPGEVIIKNAAVAINPVEWKIQDSGLLPFEYPGIFGADVAGIIQEVGEGVTRLHKGQRVMAYCHGIATKKPENGGFQLYSVVPEILTSPIPDSLSFECAAVLPLALSTAAAGLYEDTTLGLPLPPADGSISSSSSSSSSSSGGTLLVWGAASAVGLAVVQLARASGLRVIATASARNHDLVRSLGGGSEVVVLDYKAPTVVPDAVAAVRSAGGIVGAFDAISDADTIGALGAILEEVGPTKVAMVLFPPGPLPRNYKAVQTLSFTIPNPPHDHVGDGIWRKWVPNALAKGLLQAKPDPLVVGAGLESIQGAMDRQKAGVSAQKIVVTL